MSNRKVAGSAKALCIARADQIDLGVRFSDGRIQVGELLDLHGDPDLREVGAHDLRLSPKAFVERGNAHDSRYLLAVHQGTRLVEP